MDLYLRSLVNADQDLSAHDVRLVSMSAPTILAPLLERLPASTWTMELDLNVSALQDSLESSARPISTSVPLLLALTEQPAQIKLTDLLAVVLQDGLVLDVKKTLVSAQQIPVSMEQDVLIYSKTTFVFAPVEQMERGVKRLLSDVLVHHA